MERNRVTVYVESCRAKTAAFARQQFQFSTLWELQRKTLWHDLLVSPFNAVWSIPYLAIKKTLEALEKLGVTSAGTWAERLPSGFRSGLQKSLEEALCREVLDWNVLRSPERPERDLPKKSAKAIKKLVDQYSASRALVSDLAGTGITLLLGKFVFGNATLSLHRMAYLFAKKKAHDEAASNFFLGKSVGSTFYDLFPPSANETDIKVFFVALFVFLTLATMAAALLSDPIRGFLGLHERRLQHLLNTIEKELLYLHHKEDA